MGVRAALARLPLPGEADALLARLASAAAVGTLAAAAPAATALLEPLLRPSGEGSADRAALARAFAPFLVRLVKLAFGLLADQAACACERELHAAADLAEAGVAGLEALRGALRGRPHELEVQRYTLVRRLAGRRLLARAAAQAERLLAAICARWGAPPPDPDHAADAAAGARTSVQPAGARAAHAGSGGLPGGPAVQRACGAPLPRLPRPAGGEPREDAAVVVGTVLNLAACAAEGHPGGDAAQAALRLLPAFDALEPWLRCAGAARLCSCHCRSGGSAAGCAVCSATAGLPLPGGGGACCQHLPKSVESHHQDERERLPHARHGALVTAGDSRGRLLLSEAEAGRQREALFRSVYKVTRGTPPPRQTAAFLRTSPARPRHHRQTSAALRTSDMRRAQQQRRVRPLQVSALCSLAPDMRFVLRRASASCLIVSAAAAGP